MVCSTAAKSSMKVICACYTPTSLQYLCCARLRQMLPCCPDIVNAMQLPPGLRTVLQIQHGWVFALSSTPDPSEEEDYMPETCQKDAHKQISVPSSPCLSRCPSPVSTLSACADPYPETVPQYHCPCHTTPQNDSTACHCPPTPPSSDYESCCSDPEDYQCKRCRWTKRYILAEISAFSKHMQKKTIVILFTFFLQNPFLLSAAGYLQQELRRLEGLGHSRGHCQAHSVQLLNLPAPDVPQARAIPLHPGPAGPGPVHTER
ncbi:hypothetical protein XENOCAPTIV_017553 [Xenoophorus captivus]|uniref:SOCS box domain-containing protein n=1 Tax=Xenoophorus captivus TaxID=1517983 RepID=A0ABV0R0W9_9TELE